jgi:hypothetical protein
MHRDQFTFFTYYNAEVSCFSNDRKYQGSGTCENRRYEGTDLKWDILYMKTALLSLGRDIASNRVINGKKARFQIKFRG